MRHYPHHIGDFNSATRHLTRVERSLYRDLIDLYYDTEQPLNGDFEKLARRVICDEIDKPALRDVLNEFFICQDDGCFHNARCDAEIAKYQGQIEQASRAGKASAAKRYGTDSTVVQRALDSCTTNQNQEPEPEPITNKPIKEKKSASAPLSRPDDVSEQIWGDWLQLRKTKKATVSLTVVSEARSESVKAGLTLERFLSIWCARGSQGMQADWIKPAERATVASKPQSESFAERDSRHNREEWERMSGRKWPEDDLPSDARQYTPLSFVIDENTVQRIA